MRGKRYVRRGHARAARPTRTWMYLGESFGLSGVTLSSTAAVMRMEAQSGTSITSDPPEDLTILRVRGTLEVHIDGSGAPQKWTLVLTVQDTDWILDGYAADADKRFLWTKTFATTEAPGVHSWYPGGLFELDANSPSPFPMMSLELDIAPKVKLTPGKALYLAAYDLIGGAGALTCSMKDARVLFQRTRR